MPNELYRDFIDGKADEIINALGGTITPAPANAELYRDFLDRKFDDVINATKELRIEQFAYTGTGGTVNQITFPKKPKYILNIQRETDVSSQVINSVTCVIIWGLTVKAIGLYQGSTGVASIAVGNINFDDDTHMTITGSTAGQSFNATGRDYQVLYIPESN